MIILKFVLKPPSSLNTLFNQFNNSSQNHEGPLKCCQVQLLQSRRSSNHEISNKKCSSSLFHIKTCSLTKHYEDLNNLLKAINTNFDIIAISDTRL